MGEHVDTRGQLPYTTEHLKGLLELLSVADAYYGVTPEQSGVEDSGDSITFTGIVSNINERRRIESEMGIPGGLF